jgi:hypothetical protein
VKKQAKKPVAGNADESKKANTTGGLATSEKVEEEL